MVVREGTMSLARGAAAFDGRVSMIVEPGMNFVLEQPVDKGYVWRPEFSGNEIQLLGQELKRAPDGDEKQQFTFQAAKVGTHIVRLHEEQGPQEALGKAMVKRLRTVTYTIVAAVSPEVKI